jgi:hypothetical protein
MPMLVALESYVKSEGMSLLTNPHMVFTIMHDRLNVFSEGRAVLAVLIFLVAVLIFNN